MDILASNQMDEGGENVNKEVKEREEDEEQDSQEQKGTEEPMEEGSAKTTEMMEIDLVQVSNGCCSN